MANQAALGLIINDNSLELLGITSLGGEFGIAGYTWTRLEEGIVRAGRVVEAEALAQQIKKLMGLIKPKLQKKPIVLGLPQSLVFLKVFTIPKFQEKELDEAIGWHVGSLGLVLPEESYMSYEIVGKGKKNEVKVLLVAAGKTVVDEYIKALELAEIEVKVIEPLAIAGARLVNPKQLLNKSVLNAHLYRNKLSASVLVNGKLWFSKEVMVGEGEEGKIQAVAGELIKYFSERKEKDTANVSEIVFSGDNDGIERIKRSLVGFKLSIVKAEAGIVLADTGIVENTGEMMFSPLVGLAMRGGVNHKGLINLLPEWPKEKVKVKKLGRLMSKMVTIMGLTVWFTVGILEAGWWWLGKENLRLKTQEQNLQTILTEQKEAELLNWGKGFNETVKTIELIEGSRASFSQILGSLSGLMPKTVKLTALTYNSKSQNWSLAGTAEKREDVLVLDQALKQSEWFKEARLYFSSLESSEGILFRFSGGGSGNK